MSDRVEDSLSDDEMAVLSSLKDAHGRIRAELAKVVVGQDEVIEQWLIAIFSTMKHVMFCGVKTYKFRFLDFATS